MFNFQRGDLTGVQWVPVVGPPFVAAGPGAFLTVKDQDLDFEALLYDVTSTLAGGVRQRLGGPLDAGATINAVYDYDQSPYVGTININPGAGGILNFAISIVGLATTRFLQFPMRIQKVHWKAGVENAVSYSFDAKIDGRVGSIVFPAA